MSPIWFSSLGNPIPSSYIQCYTHRDDTYALNDIGQQQMRNENSQANDVYYTNTKNPSDVRFIPTTVITVSKHKTHPMIHVKVTQNNIIREKTFNNAHTAYKYIFDIYHETRIKCESYDALVCNNVMYTPFGQGSTKPGSTKPGSTKPGSTKPGSTKSTTVHGGIPTATGVTVNESGVTWYFDNGFE
jgi:hypothetical protein